MAALLSLDVAKREYDQAAGILRNVLLLAERLRIDTDFAKGGLPDISGPLALLAKGGRYDECKTIIEMLEQYAEAQVNYQIAESRADYARIVGSVDEPEYLRSGRG